MKSVSIIIPCYNCENSILNDIKKILKKIKKTRLGFEIILINDGSEDSTIDKLRLSLRFSKKIKIINFSENKGKSFVIRKAITKSKYNHIIMIDNNLPYFEVFNTIIKKLKKNYDLVLVNRRNKKSSFKKKSFSIYQVLRFLIGYTISLIIKYSLKLDIDGCDTQAGLKGFKKIKNFKNINFISKIFFYDLELIFAYYKLDKKIFSVPVKYEIPNKSSIKIFSIGRNLAIMHELFSVILNLKRIY
tara:strand:- start:4245 stop:4979 length:735 start_codon:yes stop_codon:yes gene_type:complete